MARGLSSSVRIGCLSTASAGLEAGPGEGSRRMGNLRHEPYPSGWHERMAGADDLFKLRL
jgi:hypothetical protein